MPVAPPALAVISTAPIYSRLHRLALWPPVSHPLSRVVLVLARFTDVPAVHRHLKEDECFLSNGSLLSFVDYEASRAAALKQDVPGPKLASCSVLTYGPYLVLGEPTMGSDGCYYPRDHYDLDEAVQLTLRYAHQQARAAYVASKGEEARLRYEHLDRRLRALESHA